MSSVDGNTLTAPPPAAPVEPHEAERTAWWRSRWANDFSVIVGRILLPLIVLGSWEVLSRAGVVNEGFFSRPSLVWNALVDYAASGQLLTQTQPTLVAVGLSLLIGVPAGIVFGAVLAEVRWLDRVVNPYLVPLNSIPRVALVPVFLIWFGLSTQTKVAVAVSIIFFMVVLTTRAGIRGIEPDLLMVGRSLGLRRVRVFTKIVLPGSVPTVFAGIRLAVTYSLLGVIATEMIAARSGLGLDIVQFGQTLQVSGVFALLLVLMVLSAVLDAILEVVERRLLRWQ